MKLSKLFLVLIGLSFFIALPALADTSPRGCETNSMKAGSFCNWDDGGRSWCDDNTNTCAVESTVEQPSALHYFSCDSNSWVCNSGYANCSGTCTLYGSSPNCHTYNTCAAACTTCDAGYTLSSGACVGATLKLGSTSVSGSNVIQDSTTPHLYVTGNKLGVGESTPTANLHLTSSTDTEGLRIISSNYSPFVVRNAADDADLFRIDEDGTITPPISGSSNWTLNGSNLYASSTTWNVGIGTSNPTHKLSVTDSLQVGDGFAYTPSAINTDFVVGNADGSSRFLFGQSNSVYGGMKWFYNSTSAYSYLGIGAKSDHSFKDIVINQSGNIGIGTTNPLSKLHIGSDGSLANGLTFGDGDTGIYEASNYMYFKVSNTPSAGFTTNGMFLSVGSTGNGYLLKQVSSSVLPVYSFVGDTNTGVGRAGADILSLIAGGVNGLNVDGSGNVGIGTTTPTTKLSVVGDTGEVLNVNGGRIMGLNDTPVNDDEAVPLGYLEDNYGTGSGWSLDGNTVGQVTSIGTLDEYDMPFLTNGVERMRLTSNGNLAIGTNSTGVRLHVESSQGAIAFFKSTLNGGSYSGYIGNGQTFSGEEFGLYYALNDTRLATYDVANSLSLYGGHLDTDPRIVINEGTGNVGIGTSNPDAYTLNVAGSIYAATGLDLDGNLTLGQKNISGVNKLTVNTIDPLYNIKGINYSTFASSIAGGVKEEYIGRGSLNNLTIFGEYELVLDFDNIKEGSDLWVWHQVVDFNSENVEAIVTPYGSYAQVYYLIKDNSIIFRSDKMVDISYRLSGKRHDWRQWPTKAVDQTEKAGFIIE